jgi:hypothetical protein
MASSDRTGSIIRLVLILAAAIALFALIAYYRQNRRSAPERFSASAGVVPVQQPAMPKASSGSGSGDGGWDSMPSPIEPMSNEAYLPLPRGAGAAGPSSPTDPFPQDRITPDQLLPKDASNSQWAKANPAGQGDVKDQNFLTAGYHIGFDTQGSSLRNASHDIRSAPPNPRYRVSIWQQSTIEPDMNRRPLE